jgi:hypothetical protein
VSSVSDWPADIVKYLASNGLRYNYGTRTTAPVRVLSADMILCGIATPTQLGHENARDLPEQGDARRETAYFPLTWSLSFSVL